MLEVLISMAIMASLFVIVLATFNATRKTFAYVDRMQDRWHVVRNGMARMTQDLSMAYISLNEDMSAVERRTYFRYTKGDFGDELRFSSFAHRRLYKDANESDQCILQYFLAPDPEDNSKTSLFRRETRRLGNEEPGKLPGEAYVLIDNVVDLRYEFFDRSQDKWSEEWDTTAVDGQPNRLPNQIRIYLTIKTEKDRELVLVNQVAPALTDALVLTPGAAGAAAPGATSGNTRTNPFGMAASNWSNLRSNTRGKWGAAAGGGKTR